MNSSTQGAQRRWNRSSKRAASASAASSHSADLRRWHRHGLSVSVCLPARNEEATIGEALGPLLRMRDQGFIDQVVVVDDSADYTPDIAESLGAEIHSQRALVPELGAVEGKGDALWRSLSILSGDVLLFLDADSLSIQRHYVLAMCGPLLDGAADLVKGFYRRPLGGDPDGGGRVNHLLARPLLRAHFPRLAWVKQPLAGETALTRDLAHSLPFVCGYGVEIGLLLDAHQRGARIAQVDLHRHEHRHRSLAALSAMSDEIAATVLNRAAVRNGLMPPAARPPMRDYAPLALTRGIP